MEGLNFFKVESSNSPSNWAKKDQSHSCCYLGFTISKDDKFDIKMSNIGYKRDDWTGNLLLKYFATDECQ